MISHNRWFVVILIAFAITSCGGKVETSMGKSSEVVSIKQVGDYGEKQRFIPIPDSCPKKHYVYLSWNLANFGKSKTPETLELMADISKEADIIAGQEISVSDAGAQAVAQYAGLLGERGRKWDYVISDRTQPTSPGVERYTYLWAPSIMEVNRRKTHLVADLEEAIDREPYSVTFHIGDNVLTAFTIHAVPTAKKPIYEVEALAKSGELNQSGNMILSGDFNLGADETDPLLEKVGFSSHIHEKTSLKQKVGKNGEYTLYQYDNIYTKGEVRVCASGVVDFPSKLFSPITDTSLKAARKLSDHLPVYIVFYFTKQ